MERKRGSGQTVGERAGESSDDEPARSSQTRLIRRARWLLVNALPQLAVALAEQAEKGSVPHMKLLLEMLGLDKGGFAAREIKVKERTLEEILMEQWHKEP
jgi:hypothetical protein